MALTRATIDDFLTPLSKGLKEIKSEWERQELQDAPRFRGFLSLFPRGEVKLTAITAELLKPDGRHGQRTRLLKAFLSVAKVKTETDLSGARVAENHRTSDGRLIDLLVHLPPDYALAVESKACGAQDSDGQVADYISYLKEVSPRGYKLLYLSQTGDNPSQASISDDQRAKAEQEGHLEVQCYSEFMKNWLACCIEVSKAPRVCSFLDEFRKYLATMMTDLPEETYMSSLNTETLIGDAALSSPEHLETSLAIFKHFQAAVWSRVVNEFAEQLERELKDSLNSKGSGWEVGRDPYSDEDKQKQFVAFSSNWSGLSFWKRSWKGVYRLRTEAGKDRDWKEVNPPLSERYPRSLDARVEWDDDKPNHAEIPGLRSALASLNLQERQRDNVYWYGTFREPYNDFASLHAIRAMRDGSALDYVADVLLQLSDLAGPILDQEISRGRARLK